MNEELNKTYDALVADTKEISDLANVVGFLEWDQETYMPAKGVEAKSRQLSLLSGIIHHRQTSAQRGEWIAALAEKTGDLDDGEKATLRELSRNYERLMKLPAELVMEEKRTTSLAHGHWVSARKKADFSEFAPWLEKIFDIKKRIAGHWGYPETPYDAMLDDYEPGATARVTGEILGALREKLVPWVHKIAASPVKPRTDFLARIYPTDVQKRLTERAMKAIGFDVEAGRLDISAHPFCTGTGGDVRLTTRYFEDQPFASLYGVIHEAGHGLYEQGLPETHLGAPLGVSSAMSIHESQSRLWENVVGRSRAFLKFFEPHLREAYPTQLSGVSLPEIYAVVNRVEPSFIRVEADEVTYSLHIILRFEIERDLLSGALSVGDVPAAWNKKVNDYLGITPPNDAEGCLQDIHWCLGLVGYFPSYALGSLNAAQLFAVCKKDMPNLDTKFERGEFTDLLAWLRANVHSKGRMYPPNDLIAHVTGKPPSSDDFMVYIAEKFSELYKI